MRCFTLRYLFCLLIKLPYITTLYGQAVYYSTNPLTPSADYEYNIVGNVKGNIIVWKTYLKDHFKSDIFIYDNSMRLIKKVNTNIFVSDINPDLKFFVLKNSFLAFYHCKNQNTFLYKLTRFDELGNFIASETLDSIDVTIPENCFYKTLQPEHNNSVCFLKVNSDLADSVLKFKCFFIDDYTITKKDYNVSFIQNEETLIDLITDANRNVTILTGAHKDSLLKLKLMTLKFSGQSIEENTKISNYYFEENSLHISKTSNGYLILGKLEKPYDTGDTQHLYLYCWQTDSDFKNFKDTIISKSKDSNTVSFAMNIPDNDEANTFAIWSIVNTGDKENIYNWNNSNEQLTSYKFVYPALEEYPLYYAGFITNSNIYLPPTYNRSITDYAKKRDTSNISSITHPVISSIEVFSLNKNFKTIWSDIFKDTIDDITIADLSNAKVIKTNKAVHIIYEVHTSKKTSTLDHIVINDNGIFSRNFIATWNTKCSYNLNSSILTQANELIVPTIEGNRLRFAKIKLNDDLQQNIYY